MIDSIYATHGKGAWKSKLMVNDRIADSIFQQIVTRPDEYAVLATPNLNGDYISDAAAAQVGGLGIAPGANIGDQHAIFEATHGTAPKYADKDVINPGSVMLSGVMMFDFMGWTRGGAADRRFDGATILAKEGHLRLRTHAGRRNQGQDQRVRQPHDPEHGSGGSAGGEVAGGLSGALAQRQGHLSRKARAFGSRPNSRDSCCSISSQHCEDSCVTRSL